MASNLPTIAPPLEVASLLGHAQVDLALACLGSLRDGSAEPIALRLHDDGSLTAADRERLALGLGAPAIVSRGEADDRVAQVLAGRPALAAYRRAHPLALKLVDLAVLAPREEIAYCDADVLFLRPFSGLFRPLGEGIHARFMHDRQNAYSLRSWHLARDRTLRLPARVNTGLVHARTALFDPDRLEWFLARPEFQFAPPWIEQTAWALLAGDRPSELYDPRQIAFPAALPPPPETVALHFVSPLRHLLAPHLAHLDPASAADRRGEPPVEILSRPARRCGPLDLAATELGRRARRLLGR